MDLLTSNWIEHFFTPQFVRTINDSYISIVLIVIKPIQTIDSQIL